MKQLYTKAVLMTYQLDLTMMDSGARTLCGGSANGQMPDTIAAEPVVTPAHLAGFERDRVAQWGVGRWKTGRPVAAYVVDKWTAAIWALFREERVLQRVGEDVRVIDLGEDAEGLLITEDDALDLWRQKPEYVARLTVLYGVSKATAGNRLRMTSRTAGAYQKRNT